MSGLLGKRVVVTRAKQNQLATIRMLEARGAVAISCPTIAIQPVISERLDELISSLSLFDWLVFTSTNAVSITCGRIRELGITVPKTLKIAAVGATTARVVRKYDLNVNVIPTVYNGAELTKALSNINGANVLFPRSRIASRYVYNALANAGALVTDISVYDTTPVELDESTFAAMNNGVDAILFASPSSVVSFSSSQKARAILANAVVASIGETSAAKAALIECASHIVAPSATMESLIGALDQHFQRIEQLRTGT